MTSLWQHLKSRLAHAFAVPSDKDCFSEEELALLDRTAGFIVKKKMAAPAVLFLESMQPLSFLGNQVMIFLQPIVTPFFSTQEYERVARILERRESISVLIARIEEKQDPDDKVRKGDGVTV
ncbi:MAG: hypothetical protein V1800_14900 [Candidatus Latescibacterota bacterium]